MRSSTIPKASIIEKSLNLQMSITVELTNAANKTSRKSWLEENQAEVEQRIKIHNESVVSIWNYDIAW